MRRLNRQDYTLSQVHSMPSKSPETVTTTLTEKKEKDETKSRIKPNSTGRSSKKQKKSKKPLDGYRRVTTRVNKMFNTPINPKRVYRLMKEGEPLCKKLSYDATKHNKDYRGKPQPDEPKEQWSIDMTKHYIDGYGWQPVIAVYKGNHRQNSCL